MSVTVPGKTILFGEHAVVHGHPALAAPLSGVELQAAITAASGEQPIDVIGVPDEHEELVRKLIGLLLEETGWELDHHITVSLNSTIPVGCGLGSSAALAVALTEALAEHLEQDISVKQVSDLAYELEKVFHGTPSGVDNTVVAFRQPVYFRPGREPRRIELGGTYRLLIANTGVASNTAELVAEVRQRKEAEPEPTDRVLEAIGEVVQEARELLEGGGPASLLGELMDRNQQLLAELGVSAACNEELIEAARGAGALGAKLTGAGRGGNVIALVSEETEVPAVEALKAAGAEGVWSTLLEALPEREQRTPQHRRTD